MDWTAKELPLEISSGPFEAVFMGLSDPPIRFHPGWVIVDASGNAVATVARGIDATYLCELLNKGK